MMNKNARIESTIRPGASGAEAYAPRLIGLDESAAIAIATCEGIQRHRLYARRHAPKLWAFL